MENSNLCLTLRLFVILQVFIFGLTVSAAERCTISLLTFEQLLTVKNENNHPVVSRNGKVATVTIDGIHERVRHAVRYRKLLEKDMTVSLFVNGVEKYADKPFGTLKFENTEAPQQQMDYTVVYKHRGKDFDISRFDNKESKDGQNVHPDSFQNLYSGEAFGINFGKSLKKKGLSALLTKSSVKLGNKKVVWVLSPEADPQVKEFIAAAVQGVDVKAIFGKQGYPQEVLVTDRATGKIIRTNPKNFFFKVDAAFSGNAFFWDDMLVALATVPYHPWLAASTIDFWLMVQSRNGGVIPREVRKENLISLWFPTHVKNGEEPQANLIYTNPNLMNWAMRELYKFDPSKENLGRLKKVSDSITDYAEWMEKNRAVLENGKIIGFNGSALGTGLDNSRGEIGNQGEKAAYKTAFVDFIAQHISMLKDQSDWNQILAKETKNTAEQREFLEVSKSSKEKAQYYETVLNERYYNEELKFYFDLSPTENEGFEQNTNYHTIAGFWPLYAKAVPPERLSAIIEKQLTPEAFGGDFPLPANARHSIDNNAKVTYKKRGNKTTDEDGYWDKWAHWPSMAMVVIEGFRLSGRPDIAHKLAVDYLKKMAESSELTVEENYGERIYRDNSGKIIFKARVGQHAEHVHRADFAGWGKGPPIYIALLDVMGIKPNYNKTLTWELRNKLDLGEDMGITNLRYSGTNIENLEIKKISEYEYEIKVTSEGKFKFNLATLVDQEGVLRPNSQGRGPTMTIGGGKDLTYRIVLR